QNFKSLPILLRCFVICAATQRLLGRELQVPHCTRISPANKLIGKARSDFMRVRAVSFFHFGSNSNVQPRAAARCDASVKYFLIKVMGKTKQSTYGAIGPFGYTALVNKAPL